MATIDLGKIKQVFRGTYDNSTAYVPDDLVVFTDTGITSTYICTTASTGNNPSSGGTAHANWAYVAKGVADPIPSQSGQSGKFLTTNGSALSFGTVSAGITMADTWYVSAGLDPASGANVITANWTRNTNTNNGRIGSAMTQSSGIFTFPSTGIYHIYIEGSFFKNDSTSYNFLGFYIQPTENNATYTTAMGNYQALPSQSNNTYISTSTSFIFDVVNTSTHKVRFAIESDGSGTSVVDFNGRRMQVVFTRLGDT
tara:strand:+ start:902 stop:1666 length:765 start_codon:yes stop_codon:yes gene_type:complete